MCSPNDPKWEDIRPQMVDESRGPGKPLSFATDLAEIWEALGHYDGRSPSLDEVLIEVRDLMRIRSLHHVKDARQNSDQDAPEFLETEDEDYHGVRSVTWGTSGMTVVGYSVEDVLAIRKAYQEEMT
jgi:hypothetical protein